MYRKILVAVDGSSTSEEALVSAARLARGLSARLRIMHVTDSPYDYPDVMYGHVPGDLDELHEAWHKAGQEVIDRAVVAALREGCAAEPRLVEGSGSVHVSEHVVEEARAWGADIIVVGASGRRGVKRLLLGSVAEGVARLARVPVLLVRAPNASS